MTNAPRKQAAKAALVSSGTFDEVLALIEAARRRAYQAVNTELVTLYWQVGEYISKKIERAEWGDGVVDELASTITRQYPGMRGYTRRNLFRMRQFFETYRGLKKVSPLVTQLPWTHHLILLSQTMLPPKALLRRKLHELYAQLAPEEPGGDICHGPRDEVGGEKPRARRATTGRKGRRP